MVACSLAIVHTYTSKRIECPTRSRCRFSSTPSRCSSSYFFFLTRCFTHVFLRVQFGCVLNIYKYMYIQNLCIHVCVCVCVYELEYVYYNILKAPHIVKYHLFCYIFCTPSKRNHIHQQNKCFVCIQNSVDQRFLAKMNVSPYSVHWH